MNTPNQTPPQLLADAMRLRAEFNELRNSAETAAEAALAKYRKAGGAKYWPSKMTAASLANLRRVLEENYAAQIEHRFAQLDRINHELDRLDKTWDKQTPEQLRRLPETYYWRGGQL